MLVEILAIVLVFLIVLFIWLISGFRRWKRNVLSNLHMGSSIANTSVGPIEYTLQGEGPVLLPIHGAPGGYDQSLFVMEKWPSKGFSVLACSRPGYLQTPLTSGETYEEQADAIAALLDSLGISRVAVLGVSAGGPPALQFALRHPDRIWALVMVSAVSEQYGAKKSQRSSLLGSVILSDAFMDIGIWMFNVLTEYWPSISLKQMFKENLALQSKEIDNYVDRVIGTPEQVEWYKRFIRTASPLSPRKAGLRNDLKRLAQVSMQHLDTIVCPTFVIHGTADRDVAFSNAEFTAATIPDAKLCRLERVGHIVWLGNHVEQMNSELLTFLRAHAPENA